jgi:hypothetical protein
VSDPINPREYYRTPRRNRGDRSLRCDGTGRVRVSMSLTPEDAALLDAASGPYAPTGWAAGEVMAVVRARVEDTQPKG